MSIREDITINWDVSPRIIEVAAPSQELKVQDLYDTLRSLGSVESSIDEPEIVDASGKEKLLQNVYVGLTVKLLNAKVKFENRSSPTLCDVYGGNLLAVDINGDVMNPIEPSDNVTVTKTSSTSASIIQVGSGLTTEEHDMLCIVCEIDKGRWKIENYQLKMYDALDNLIRTFNLFDKNGYPAEEGIFERVPV